MSSWLFGTSAFAEIFPYFLVRILEDETMRTSTIVRLLVYTLIINASVALAQTTQAPNQTRQKPKNNVQASQQRYDPTKADMAYGDHERQVLDFWQAETVMPAPLFIWIHGGGFRGGDKKSFPRDLRTKCLEAGISCASIH